MNWMDFKEIDSDGDGVSDSNDNCPDTPQGTRVDVNGCPVFELPLNNFKVEVGSATCVGKSDGVINLSVEDASYDYSVTITVSLIYRLQEHPRQLRLRVWLRERMRYASRL